jgi:hypothetical protein
MAIILYTLMNLAWELFAISQNAFEDMPANILRGISIAFLHHPPPRL